MKFTSIAVLVTFVASVSATPALARRAPKGHGFQKPGPGDSRSPCPGLNSLGITVEDFVKACHEGLNVGPSFYEPIGHVGLMSKCTTATKMDLEELKHHDVLIEDDGSLSRQDHYFGPDYLVNKRSYDMFIAPFKGHKHTTLQLASLTKFGRVNHSLTDNPKVSLGAREVVLSYGETALYLQTTGRDLFSGVADVDYSKMVFGEERLPYELGWAPGPLVTLASIGAMAVRLQANGPTPGDEAIYTLTSGTYEELIEGTLILYSTLKPFACGKE